MPLKIVHFYQQKDQGWTETYYTQDATVGSFRQKITRQGLEKFAGIRAPLTNFVAVRITELTGQRNSSLYLISPAIPGNAHQLNISNLGNPEPVSTDSLSIIYGQTGKSRRIAIRGIRDSDVIRDFTGLDTVGPNWVNDFGFMVQQMVNWGYCIRWGSYPKPPGNPWFNVSSITPSATPGFVVVTVGGIVPPGYQSGDRVHFVGIPSRGLPLFGSNHTVTQGGPNANQFVIPYGIQSSIPAVLSRMFVTIQSYAYDPISYGVFERFSERKTGRPTFVPRGRRRAVSVYR